MLNRRHQRNLFIQEAVQSLKNSATQRGFTSVSEHTLQVIFKVFRGYFQGPRTPSPEIDVFMAAELQRAADDAHSFMRNSELVQSSTAQPQQDHVNIPSLSSTGNDSRSVDLSTAFKAAPGEYQIQPSVCYVPEALDRHNQPYSTSALDSLRETLLARSRQREESRRIESDAMRTFPVEQETIVRPEMIQPAAVDVHQGSAAISNYLSSGDAPDHRLPESTATTIVPLFGERPDAIGKPNLLDNPKFRQTKETLQALRTAQNAKIIADLRKKK